MNFNLWKFVKSNILYGQYKKKFGGCHFFKGAVSLVRLVLSPKIVINLTKIHEKLYCKGKPYRLRTQRQTDILLLLKKDYSMFKKDRSFYFLSAHKICNYKQISQYHLRKNYKNHLEKNPPTPKNQIFQVIIRKIEYLIIVWGKSYYFVTFIFAFSSLLWFFDICICWSFTHEM